MIVARGDAETLRSLTQNLNITSLVVATILPLGTTILTWFYLFALLTAMVKPKGERLKSFRKSSWYLVVIAVIDFIAMPMAYGAVNLAIFLIFVAFVLITRAANKRANGRLAQWVLKFSQVSSRVWIFIFLGGPLLIWLCFLGVYLPKERLEIGLPGAKYEVAPVYVLSIDDRWTKYMDAAHKVHIVPTADVRGRAMVGTSYSHWRATPMDLVSSWWRGGEKALAPPPAPPPTSIGPPTNSTAPQAPSAPPAESESPKPPSSPPAAPHSP